MVSGTGAQDLALTSPVTVRLAWALESQADKAVGGRVLLNLSVQLRCLEQAWGGLQEAPPFHLHFLWPPRASVLRAGGPVWCA